MSPKRRCSAPGVPDRRQHGDQRQRPGGTLVRVDPAETGALAAAANATVAVLGGRAMRGWLHVSSEDLQTDEQLTEWVSRAVGYARSLPPKR